MPGGGTGQGRFFSVFRSGREEEKGCGSMSAGLALLAWIALRLSAARS